MLTMDRDLFQAPLRQSREIRTIIEPGARKARKIGHGLGRGGALGCGFSH